MREFSKSWFIKLRCASNIVFSLSIDELNQGVTTRSLSNHDAALAFTSKMKVIPSYIVIPKTISKIKIKVVEDFCVKISFCEQLFDALLKKSSE